MFFSRRTRRALRSFPLDSADESLAAVKKAGGTIVLDKNAIPGVGWLFYFKDTEGNIVGAMHNDPSAA